MLWTFLCLSIAGRTERCPGKVPKVCNGAGLKLAISYVTNNTIRVRCSAGSI